ncbi:hypothetical protein MMPV_009839, partial [Pyropia vietnamensis]
RPLKAHCPHRRARAALPIATGRCSAWARHSTGSKVPWKRGWKSSRRWARPKPKSSAWVPTERGLPWRWTHPKRADGSLKTPIARFRTGWSTQWKRSARCSTSRRPTIG